MRLQLSSICSNKLEAASQPLCRKIAGPGMESFNLYTWFGYVCVWILFILTLEQSWFCNLYEAVCVPFFKGLFGLYYYACQQNADLSCKINKPCNHVSLEQLFNTFSRFVFQACSARSVCILHYLNSHKCPNTYVF